MTNPTVALTRCRDYSEAEIGEAVARQFELLGGVERFVKRGDSVLLKPNFIAPMPRQHATQTDPAVIIEAAKLLKDYGARPFVGDSPAWGNVHWCVKKLKLDGPLKKLGVPVKQLGRGRKCRIGVDNTNVGISRAALEADAIINLPKFKTHQQLAATFAVKNMFGCVSGKRKAYFHFAKGKDEDDFCELLIGIFKYLGPVLTIIDGVLAMDGPGPIHGRARELGWLIGGTEPIACEVVCSRLVNMKAEELPIVRTARRMGFGCSDGDEIEVVGDDYEGEICMDFERAEVIPIRFSFLRICKSACKQILLLVKGGKKGKGLEL